jgi:hypothetical protein
MRNPIEKFNRADRHAIKYWVYGFAFLALVVLVANHTLAYWPISATQAEATGSIAKPTITSERLLLDGLGQVP